MSACGKPAGVASHSSTSVTLDIPDDAWTRKVSFHTKSDHAELVLDGVKFLLFPDASYELSWEAVGAEGIKVVSDLDYKTNKMDAVSPLSVDGRLVEVTGGKLTWGDEALGAISAGDEVRVSAKGVVLR